MKITKSQLKQIIKEELNNVVVKHERLKKWSDGKVLNERITTKTMDQIKAWSQGRLAGLDQFNLQWDKLRDSAAKITKFDEMKPIVAGLLELWKTYWWDTYNQQVEKDPYLYPDMVKANNHVNQFIKSAVGNRSSEGIDKVLNDAVRMSPFIMPN